MFKCKKCIEKDECIQNLKYELIEKDEMIKKMKNIILELKTIVSNEQKEKEIGRRFIEQQKKPKPKIEFDLRIYLELRKEGKTIKEISKIMKISEATIYRRKKDYNNNLKTYPAGVNFLIK